MEKYLYLLLNLLTISVPLIRSFEPKINFKSKWPHFFLANIPVAIAFILWDEQFTQAGIWGFNERYLSGLYIGSLPIEECLFFITIPYASVFLYEVLNYFLKWQVPLFYVRMTALFIAGVNLSIALSFPNKAYTFTALLVNAVLLAVLAIVKPSLLRGLFRTYIVVLPGFFLVNGVLTGSWIEEPIVWYNNTENLGFRMGTIPVEDSFYGMTLIFLNLVIYKVLRSGRHATQESTLHSASS